MLNRILKLSNIWRKMMSNMREEISEYGGGIGKGKINEKETFWKREKKTWRGEKYEEMKADVREKERKIRGGLEISFSPTLQYKASNKYIIASVMLLVKDGNKEH
ncbi:hypothetical protein VNO77_25782 [Canavalia gladiata]|uniref:Uncharacterized protein n=1 Tax=Canavalia gladiata TaxID=3824 RepID=A0AAN9KVV9_CANGL